MENNTKIQHELIAQFNETPLYRKPKPKTHKQIQIVFQNIAIEHNQDHFGTVFFVTIGLNPNKPTTIKEEWEAFVKIMPKVISLVDKKYVVSGILLGIELYEKQKRRTNNKSFKPHAHLVIFAVNEFMAAPMNKLSSALIELGLDVKVDCLPKPRDVANAMRYTIKAANDPLTNKATKVFFGTPPTSLFINTAIKANPLLTLENFIHKPTIPIAIHKKELFWKVPSVARHPDPKYSAAKFIAKLCHQQRIGFYNDMLLKRKEGTHFTWETWKPVNQFIDVLAKEESTPPGYTDFLLNNATWIMKEGATTTTEPIHTVFPRVYVAPHLWEFKNGFVYNFNTDKCDLHKATEFMSCSKYINAEYSNLPLPIKLIELVNKLTGSSTETIRLMKTLGGLFHRLTASRKTHKALWVYGTNNTYKTWLITTFLEKCFHDLLINRVPQSASTFQFGKLRGLEDGVIFIDDFRSQGFKENAQVLLNVVDGLETEVEEKYKASDTVQYKGHFAITSNEAIAQTRFAKIDKGALKERFQQVEFKTNEGDPFDLNYSNEEWAALAIIANSLYLYPRSNPRAQQIPQLNLSK